jgi:hypothetical protein
VESSRPHRRFAPVLLLLFVWGTPPAVVCYRTGTPLAAVGIHVYTTRRHRSSAHLTPASPRRTDSAFRSRPTGHDSAGSPTESLYPMSTTHTGNRAAEARRYLRRDQTSEVSPGRFRPRKSTRTTRPACARYRSQIPCTPVARLLRVVSQASGQLPGAYVGALTPSFEFDRSRYDRDNPNTGSGTRG